MLLLPVACCLLAESWLAACLAGSAVWAGLACLAGCLTACHFHGCFSGLPALPGRHSKKAAVRSWRWIIALAAAKIVAYCWKCARRVSYSVPLPLPLPLFRLLLDWPQLQAACGKDMRRPGHWHRVRVYHFNEAAAASQICPHPCGCL